MGLTAEATAPRRDPTYYDYITTQLYNYENIVGRSVELQSIGFNFSSSSTQNFTLVSDIVLTGITLSGSCIDTASRTTIIRASIDGATIHEIRLTSNNGNPQGTALFIPVPNWRLSLNQILGITITVNTDTGDGYVTFVGFLA